MAHKNTTSVAYSVTRKTYYTPLSSESVISNLYTSIGPSSYWKWPSIAENITLYNESSKEEFIKEVEAAIRPEGFMNFGTMIEGATVFNVDSDSHLGLKLMMLDNTLIAITMLPQSRRSLNAELFVPVEMLVRELPGKEGTEILWQFPSTMIAWVDDGNQGLLAAAKVLDKKLKGLVDVIGEYCK
ncbi:hypothetical protein DSL72_007360 [Monilinia vaccinii-corymbosi]|uniref:DUF302 domain-containing protein n=1 Tax=Monilinia vaccinii-corymbosi TaxID=61207 RepID=A0A8A3PMT6_9HELO|nr:hypothetical protein DSL72_007360 [Monilinia vaccinii-corymbosi]